MKIKVTVNSYNNENGSRELIKETFIIESQAGDSKQAKSEIEQAIIQRVDFESEVI